MVRVAQRAVIGDPASIPTVRAVQGGLAPSVGGVGEGELMELRVMVRVPRERRVDAGSLLRACVEMAMGEGD